MLFPLKLCDSYLKLSDSYLKHSDSYRNKFDSYLRHSGSYQNICDNGPNDSDSNRTLWGSSLMHSGNYRKVLGSYQNHCGSYLIAKRLHRKIPQAYQLCRLEYSADIRSNHLAVGCGAGYLRSHWYFPDEKSASFSEYIPYFCSSNPEIFFFTDDKTRYFRSGWYASGYHRRFGQQHQLCIATKRLRNASGGGLPFFCRQWSKQIT